MAHPHVVERHNQPVVISLTACAVRRADVFNNAAAHAALIEAWGQATQWSVGRYMIMPDHIHLFATPGVLHPEPVKDWAGYWKRLASRAQPALKGVWLRDVWDVQMRSMDHYREKQSYMEMNPVRAGLVKEPGEWPYKGCLHTIIW